MPRKNRKSKKSRNPGTKKKNLLSSPCRDESTSAEGNSSSIPANAKNEESGKDSERHEKAVSDQSSLFSETSENGRSSHAGSSRLVNDESSASLLQEVRKIDNVRNLRTIDDTSTDDVPVIHGDENVAGQKESSEAFLLDSEPAGRATKNENVSEKISFSAKASDSENKGSQEKSSEVNLLDSTLESDATIKGDVFCGSKPSVTESSREENVKHHEKSSDETSLSSDSAPAVSEIKEKVTIKGEMDSKFQVDLKPCSLTTDHPVKNLEGDSTELRLKSASSTSSRGAVNTESQLELSLKKGGKTGAPFKHTSDFSGTESNRKRAKTISTVTLQKPSQKTDKRRNQKLRAKSEQTNKTNSEFLSDKKSEKTTSSPGTSFRTKEENVEREDHSPRVSHGDMAIAKGSNTCNPEKEEFVTQSKCLSEVSPRKRKSSENTTSFSSEKALEESPSKRVQKGPGTLTSSTHESKSSPKVKKTSAKSRRSRKKPDTTNPKPVSTVDSETLSTTEYLGDAAFIAVGETPPLQHEVGSAASVSLADESKSKQSRYKVKIYKSKSNDRAIISQTESMKEYLEENEDNSTDGWPIQPMMGVSSTEVPSRRAECLHTVSSIPHRTLNVADIEATQSAKSSTEREAERLSTDSSSESIESDIHTKQEHSVACRGARPKTRGKNTQETSSHKGSRKQHVSDKVTIKFPEFSTDEFDRSPADLSREDLKETDNYCKQSSSTICMGARPKTRGKNTQISPQRGDDIERPRLARAAAESQSNRNELFPSFEEFKKTLNVDELQVVDINYDVLDRALGIDRSSDHSVREHSQEFKVISPKRFSEAVDYGPGSNDPQSSAVGLPTFEEFRNTLRAYERPQISHEFAFEIIDKALEEMESKRRNLQTKKVVRFLIPKEEILSTSARTSPEQQIDEADSQNAVSSSPCINRDPIPGILAFSGYRERGSPMGLAVPDCFDLKSIANVLDEILRSEFGNTAGEAHKDLRQPELLEDSEESIEDINRVIAKSGMKLKRFQFISSDDELTDSDVQADLAECLQFLTQDRPNVPVQIQRNSSETSQSSDANSEECSGSSSESDDTASESLAELSESDEKSTVSGQKIGEFPQISLERSSSERRLCETSDDSDNASPKKRQRKDDVEKTI